MLFHKLNQTIEGGRVIGLISKFVSQFLGNNQICGETLALFLSISITSHDMFEEVEELCVKVLSIICRFFKELNSLVSVLRYIGESKINHNAFSQ